MNECDSILELWKNFKEDIMYNNRFFPGNKKLIGELNEVLSILSKYSSASINKGFLVYRARRGEFYREEDIRKPDPKKVYVDDRRCSPRGISYFYVANNDITAIHEVKPEINEVVTIGKFKSKDSLKICWLDIINIPEENLIKELALSEKERCLLKTILQDISKPLNSQESLEYIPIQYIVECIKHKSFAGFVFGSSLVKDGKNYIFFDDSKFELVDIKHVKVKNINIKYDYIDYIV